MTRVSAGIRAIELCDKHLNKERVEIIRIPNSIKNGKAVLNSKDTPKEYKLGSGHVKFFYDKLKYLHKRYDELTKEAIDRGFNPTDFSNSFDNLPTELYNDWSETINSRTITVDRVCERLQSMKDKDIKYLSKEIDKKHLMYNLKSNSPII